MPTSDLTWQHNRDKAEPDACQKCGSHGTMVYWKPDEYVQRTVTGSSAGPNLVRIPPQCSRCGFRPQGGKHGKES